MAERAGRGRRWAVVLALGVVLAACARTGAAPDAPTTIPEGWATEENEAFVLAHPSTWESFVVDEDLVAELVGADVREAGGGIVFAAGLLRPDGVHDPNVNVVVEPIPATIDDLDELVAANLEVVGALLDGYELLGEERVEVTGRRAAILTGSYPLDQFDPDEGARWWMAQLVVYDGEMAWTVSCGTAGADEEAVADDLERCRRVVGTFRLR